MIRRKVKAGVAPSAHLPCRCYMLEARKECGDYPPKLSSTIKPAGNNPGDWQTRIS
jgi:hypothetical protein